MKAVYFEYISEKIRKRLTGWKARILSFGGRITLIKSVLCSIPIYTVASSIIPKSVLWGIDKVMANFVWNSQGERRAHWISWELLWQVLAGNSIMWSRYAKSKYFRSSEPYHTSNQSPLWKSIISHYQTLGDHSRWIVGKGELRFWRDNWCGERLGGPQPCDETLLVTQGLTIIDDLVESIPSQLRTLVSMGETPRWLL